MSFIAILLLAVGLSMDAFAVSICKGLAEKKINLRHMLSIAVFFGGFQALMPLIGWFLGVQFKVLIVNYDHFVAFVLLSYIGGKMIYDSVAEENTCAECQKTENAKKLESVDNFSYWELLVLAVGTSIDALAAGVTLAFEDVNIWYVISIIGLTTFAFSCGGVYVGSVFGEKYKNKATFAGGVILVGLGVNILGSHLGWF